MKAISVKTIDLFRLTIRVDTKIVQYSIEKKIISCFYFHHHHFMHFIKCTECSQLTKLFIKNIVKKSTIKTARKYKLNKINEGQCHVSRLFYPQQTLTIIVS